MKLAAVYNLWDGDELLEGSINCIKNHVDAIIIVYQVVSNFGELYWPTMPVGDDRTVFVRYDPSHVAGGVRNEIRKRNIGIQKAIELGCTNFFHIDCDEYYRDFGALKKAYFDSGHAGSVVKLNTYFKRPTLRLETPENYYVPFIHRLHHNTVAGVGRYPFYVDPSRRINERDVIELPGFMEHYSYVRKDINRKIRNSTARENIEKGTYLNDYNRDLKAGDYIQCYDRKLVEVPDYFRIGEMIH